jgi:ribose 5-phosphate isomerase B
MKIYISSDHGGFELKAKIFNILNNELDITDLGPNELIPDDDYPDYALNLAKIVASENNFDSYENFKEWNSLGILICRSGNGMCIAANKIKGAYAGLAFGKIHATKLRQDDNANIICLDADYEGEDPVEIVISFIKAKFAGINTRHGRRFLKVVVGNQSNINSQFIQKSNSSY